MAVRSPKTVVTSRVLGRTDVSRVVLAAEKTVLNALQATKSATHATIEASSPYVSLW